MKKAFDNDYYLKIQRKAILERIKSFGDKLYLEFGGKLFDDYHASRVLPGFMPDSKLQMLLGLKDKCEVIIVVNSHDISSNKMRADIGITYQEDVLRLIDTYKEVGLMVSSVVVSLYEENEAVSQFILKLQDSDLKVYKTYKIAGYPQNIPLIVSEDGLGKNEYVVTSRPLVIVTAPGPGSGKMATCLSQLYFDSKNGVRSGYAKYETFPVWNLPLNHAVNLAYEAATVDLNDINMIDPFHFEAYNIPAVNYNRDVEVFPLLKAIFEKIYGSSPYKSPTDMGVNKVGFAIKDESKVIEASQREIVRRYYETRVKVFLGKLNEDALIKSEMLMNAAGVNASKRKCVKACLDKFAQSGEPSIAFELNNGKIITGKRGTLLGAGAAATINALKYLAKLDKDIFLLSPGVIEPLYKAKTQLLHRSYARLRVEEIILVLSLQAYSNPLAEMALKQIGKLKGVEAHSSHILSEVDRQTFKRLGINVTEEPQNYQHRLYYKS
ncbi:MAG: DUF1846 domain-containing protein [Bacilli bacterium]|nr:DUF1846 domain-containing protein [Bacilli bacterium]